MKRKKIKEKINTSKANVLAIVIIVASLFMGIGYAAVNSVSLDVLSYVSVNGQDGFFISNATLYESSNALGNIEVYDGKFFSSNVTLTTDSTLASDSYVTFEITLVNNTPYNYGYSYTNYMLGENTYDNENIIFDVTGISVDEEIASGSNKTFYITFRYNDITNLTNNVLNSNVTFVFKNLSAMKLSELVLINEEESGNSSLVNYNNKHYFTGLEVNNYLWFNCEDEYTSGSEHCETWRIISIDEDGSIRILKDSPVTLDQITEYEEKTGYWLKSTSNYVLGKVLAEGRIFFDWKQLRPVNTELTDRYCIYTSNGCNAYSADSNMVGLYNNLHVDKDSLIKPYLENVYYVHGMTKSSKRHIKDYTYNIGLVGIGFPLDQVIEKEASITCSSKIGLLNASDYVIASNNDDCKNNFTNHYANKCITDNWLSVTAHQYYLLNGKSLTSNEKNAQVWTINTKGQIYSQDAALEMFLKPVVVLDSNVTAIGLGQNDEANYYMIVE